MTHFPATFIPHKTISGARLIASPDPSLCAELRRLLLLADGQRDIRSLATMLPNLDLAAGLDILLHRGLIEVDALAISPRHHIPPSAHLPEGWDEAADFMLARARASLGVMAVEVIDAIEQAHDHESCREAISHWYRAMRHSREGRPQADLDRVRAASMLHGLR